MNQRHNQLQENNISDASNCNNGETNVENRFDIEYFFNLSLVFVVDDDKQLERNVKLSCVTKLNSIRN